MKPVVLDLSDVSKIYEVGEQTLYALDHVNIKVCEGEFIAVVGPSGSGKSTFMYVASVLDKPSEGTVKIKDKQVSDYSEPQAAKLRNEEIGFVFQQFNLLPKTSAVENVALPLLYGGVKQSERQKRAREMLELVGLGERLFNTPAQLSGGQQQRVAFARALVTQPSIIFADEPTGNLDSKAGTEIQKMLIHLNNEGKTVVLVTHDKELAQIAKRVVLMNDGQIQSDTLTKWGTQDLKTYADFAQWRTPTAVKTIKKHRIVDPGDKL